MSISSRRNRDRRRRAGRLVFGTAKWLTLLAIFLGLGFWSYQSGLDLARSDVTRLEERLDTLGTDARDLRATNLRLEEELSQARQDIGTLQARYDRDVPAGESAAVYRLVRQRLGAGVPQDRMEQVLRDAGPVHRCEGRGTSRRFALTYGQRLPEDAGITILEGLVRVAVLVPGPADDPARTATVQVAVAGQDVRTYTGLPQRQAVIFGNIELALSVTSDVRGFATVALSGC